jgi:hypothetical protein
MRNSKRPNNRLMRNAMTFGNGQANTRVAVIDASTLPEVAGLIARGGSSDRFTLAPLAHRPEFLTN